MRSILTLVLTTCAAGAVSLSAMAASSINTGFEAPDFTVGGLNGQPASSPAADRWVVSGGGANANANVATANPNGGAQHLRITPLAAQAGANTGAFSPVISIASSTPTITKFDLASNMAPAPDGIASIYTILLADIAHGRKVAEMILDFTGDILVDDGSGGFANTGADWTSGAYQSFEIAVDPAGNSVTYKRNSVQFFTHELIPLGLNGGDTVDQIQIVTDNSNSTFGGTELLDIDNVSLLATVTTVPEPASMSLLAGAALLLGRRRK